MTLARSSRRIAPLKGDRDNMSCRKPQQGSRCFHLRCGLRFSRKALQAFQNKTNKKPKTMKTKFIAITLLLAAINGNTPAMPESRLTPTAEITWELISETTTATVYNAVENQCNNDYQHTASMYTIIPERIEDDRILAMERTMMAQFNIHYGDTVLVAGAGRYDGLWQVQDTMNKRFAGQHKIDFLVPRHIKHGKWKNVKVYAKKNHNNQ